MARLLDVIVHSTAFDQHMELLQWSRCLELPSLQRWADYLEFGAENEMTQAYTHSRDGGETDGDGEPHDEDEQPEEQDQDSRVSPWSLAWLSRAG